MTKFEEIKQVIANAEADHDKFTQKKNGAAGTRLRQALLEVSKLCKEGRVEIQETKNAWSEGAGDNSY